MSISTLQYPASILIMVCDLRVNLIKGKTSKEGHQHSIWEAKGRPFFLKTKTKLTFQKSSNYGRQRGKNNFLKITFLPPVCTFARLWAARSSVSFGQPALTVTLTGTPTPIQAVRDHWWIKRELQWEEVVLILQILVTWHNSWIVFLG